VEAPDHMSQLSAGTVGSDVSQRLSIAEVLVGWVSAPGKKGAVLLGIVV